MNKAELIERLAQRTGLTPKDARTAVDALFDTEENSGLIAAELASGGKVTISGFGTFEARGRKPRQGRNPRTGETIVGSSRVDLQACKLEYSIVSPK